MTEKRKTQSLSREADGDQGKTVSDLIIMMVYLGIDQESIHSSFGFASESFSLLESDLPIYFWVHNENHKIVYGNNRFLNKYENCVTQHCYKKLMAKENVCSCCLSMKAIDCNKCQSCKFCKRCKSGIDTNIFHWPMTSKQGDRFILKSSFYVNDSKELLKDSVDKMQAEKAYPRLLICCSSCKKIRDGGNNWVRVDKYILDHFRGRTSHGICPKCINLLYPELNI